MVSVQPIFSFKYFKSKKNTLPRDIKSLFYLSWEDAFWDVLEKKEVKSGSYVLVPDFYCSDVEKNIKNHGYKIVYYKIKKDLTVDKESFEYFSAKYKPAVVVVFHPVGIKSNLFDNKKWLIKTVKDSILVEDCVHRLIDPKEIRILKKNHFIIDSLRKVVPIQGARIFGKVVDIDFKVPPFYQSMFYALGVNTLWFLMVICWTFGLYKLAEKLMIAGYNLIGDSKLPARGLTVNRFLSDRLDISKIERYKINQVDYYEKELNKVLSFRLKLLLEDKKYLRGLPIILKKNKAQKVLNFLRKNNLMVRFELDGSKWSKSQKIIYLPLGPQISTDNLAQICSLVIKSMKLNE